MTDSFDIRPVRRSLIEVDLVDTMVSLPVQILAYAVKPQTPKPDPVLTPDELGAAILELDQQYRFTPKTSAFRIVITGPNWPPVNRRAMLSWR